MKIYSYGKINLFLDIEGKLPNGYHLIKTIMQSIDMHDEIQLSNYDKDEIIIQCSTPNIPVDERNTCYKAAAAIKEIYHINSGIVIQINKAIPSEAGLAGGSGNSAAVIRGLNIFWNLNMSELEMQATALKIGSDVPFCLTGGTYAAEGTGEKLTKLNDFTWDNILVVKPDFSMSTKFVYSNTEPSHYNLHKSSKILDYINSSSFESAARSACNSLEKVVEIFHPEINNIKKMMIQKRAINSLMTGSGSAVYGLFADKLSLEEAYKNISSIYPQTFITKTIDKGYQIIV